jgi:hypothetical protein
MAPDVSGRLLWNCSQAHEELRIRDCTDGVKGTIFRPMEAILYAVAFVIVGVLVLLVACAAVAGLVLGFERLRKRLWVRYPHDNSRRHRAHFCLWAGRKQRL